MDNEVAGRDRLGNGASNFFGLDLLRIKKRLHRFNRRRRRSSEVLEIRRNCLTADFSFSLNIARQASCLLRSSSVEHTFLCVEVAKSSAQLLTANVLLWGAINFCFDSRDPKRKKRR